MQSKCLAFASSDPRGTPISQRASLDLSHARDEPITDRFPRLRRIVMIGARPFRVRRVKYIRKAA